MRIAALIEINEADRLGDVVQTDDAGLVLSREHFVVIGGVRRALIGLVRLPDQVGGTSDFREES